MASKASRAAARRRPDDWEPPGGWDTSPFECPPGEEWEGAPLARYEDPAPAPRRPERNTNGGLAQRAGQANRPNKYGGRCQCCNEWVEAGAGWLVGRPGAWGVAHADWENSGCQRAAASAPAPTPATRAPAPEALTPGVYRTPAGDIVKVQVARTSGKPYAKAVPSGEYLGGGRALVGLVPLSLDEAKAYGRETGVCCVCSAELTDPNSIAAGIGPICASRF